MPSSAGKPVGLLSEHRIKDIAVLATNALITASKPGSIDGVSMDCELIDT